jgi:hypothetical protein
MPPAHRPKLLRFLASLVTIALPIGASTAAASAPSALTYVDELIHQPGAASSPQAAHTLAAVLAALPPLEATEAACTWALSPDLAHRRAVAGALEWSYRLVGDGLILDHLARDPDAEVRRGVARAAWARRSAGIAPGALAALAIDPDPEVREVARLALGERPG